MSDSTSAGPEGPDLSAGIPSSSVADGAPVLGHVGDEAVIVVRTGGSVRAIGATCTHYGGPLAEGLVVGDTVRCPWHHACFSLRTGEALLAPALDPVSCFRVEETDGKVMVRERITPPSLYARAQDGAPHSVVIIGAGAAGIAAAEMLRRCGYQGAIKLIDQRESAPVDRPNLSKDYLAGTAQEEWVSLRPDDFFAINNIDFLRSARVSSIDVANHVVHTDGSGDVAFDRLLIATGATPNRLSTPGSDLPSVHYLRTLSDSKAIIAVATPGSRAVVIGASFIGLEVAAALRARDVHVDVAAPEQVPLGRVLGDELGQMIRKLHEDHGVVFHLGSQVQSISPDSVTMSDGTVLKADFVVVGVGVHPDTSLAAAAGLTVDNGVIVNDKLETSVPGVFAAGDIASWPDPRVGRVRVEHWVVAERQGQTAARNMLGADEAFTLAPYFWSQHYDVKVDYVGHGLRGDVSSTSGDPSRQDCTVTFSHANGTLHAQADVGRELESLHAEVRMEQPVTGG